MEEGQEAEAAELEDAVGTDNAPVAEEEQHKQEPASTLNIV